MEKQKRARKSKQAIAKILSKPLRSAVPALISKLTLRGPDPILSQPPDSISKTSRKRIREDDSSPVAEPVQKRRLIRTQFGKRNLDTESEYGETSHDGIGGDGGDDEDEASVVDEDSTGDVVEEEEAEEEETESTEEPDEDEVWEEDVTPVRRKAPPKKGIARRSRKGSHRTEAARRALAEERLRLSILASAPQTRSNSGQVTPVPRTRSARGTPDERSKVSQAALEDARPTPRSGLLSKVARKGRR